MDYLFLGSDRRIGTFRAKGPVTEEDLAIPVTGTWINEDDAEVLLTIKIPYFCHRLKRVLEIQPVFELSYTEDQLKIKPSN